MLPAANHLSTQTNDLWTYDSCNFKRQPTSRIFYGSAIPQHIHPHKLKFISQIMCK